MNPRRITIIQGHPDPNARHLCHALVEAYTKGAIEAGHEVRHVEIADTKFPFLRNQDEFEHAPIPQSLKLAQEAIVWADHLLIVFPLWLGTMPALLKGFFEQVFRPSFAFAYGKRGMPKKLLVGRSARVVVTMGMPVLLYRWYFGAHGLHGLERNILRFVGIAPIRRSLFGMAEAVSPAKRKEWLDKLTALGRRGT